MLGTTMPWGSTPQFNAYGANLNYDFKVDGDGTYGLSPMTSLSDNYWSGGSTFNQPSSYNQLSNPFGSLAGAASKAMGGMFPGGGAMNALNGFNMAQTYAGMSAINAADEANRRKIDTAYYKLGDEWSRFTNARNYLGEGTLLDQGASNLRAREFFNNSTLDGYQQAKQTNSDKFNRPMQLAGKLNLNSPYG